MLFFSIKYGMLCQMFKLNMAKVLNNDVNVWKNNYCQTEHVFLLYMISFFIKSSAAECCPTAGFLKLANQKTVGP